MDGSEEITGHLIALSDLDVYSAYSSRYAKECKRKAKDSASAGLEPGPFTAELRTLSTVALGHG